MRLMPAKRVASISKKGSHSKMMRYRHFLCELLPCDHYCLAGRREASVVRPTFARFVGGADIMPVLVLSDGKV